MTIHLAVGGATHRPQPCECDDVITTVCGDDVWVTVPTVAGKIMGEVVGVRGWSIFWGCGGGEWVEEGGLLVGVGAVVCWEDVCA